jgi:hypothetical protein
MIVGRLTEALSLSRVAHPIAKPELLLPSILIS